MSLSSENPVTALRPELLRLAATHGVIRLRLFGSAARGDATAQSDLDLLADLAPGRDLLDLIGLQQDAEALLGRHVDVVTEAGLSAAMRERVLAEAIPL